MTRWILLIAAGGLLAAVSLSCTHVNVGALCSDMCDELVGTCSFEAFPEDQPNSCYEGCLYDDAEHGAAVIPLTECVLEAECDPFVILQCQRLYGGTEEGGQDD